MIKNKNRKSTALKIVLGLFAAALVLTAGTVKAGFGISPPYVMSDKLTRGSHYEQKIIVITGSQKSSIKIKIDIDVPEADKWISIDRGDEFTIPSGTENMPIVVSVDVPQNAEYKRYQGKININTVPDVISDSVGVVLGGQVNVDLTVVEKKIVDFDVKSIQSMDGEFGGLIKFLLNLENKGNVEVAPTRISLEIYDESKQGLISTKENLAINDRVKAFDSGDIVVSFDANGLEKGNYQGKLKTYNDTILINESEVGFNILDKKATASENGSILGKLALNQDWSIYILLAAIVLLLGVLILRKKVSKKIKKIEKKEKK